MRTLSNLIAKEMQSFLQTTSTPKRIPYIPLRSFSPQEDVTISPNICTTTQIGVSPNKYFCFFKEMWLSPRGNDGVSLGRCAHPPNKMMVFPQRKRRYTHYSWGDVFMELLPWGSLLPRVLPKDID